jgi:hypothetical protein
MLFPDLHSKRSEYFTGPATRRPNIADHFSANLLGLRAGRVQQIPDKRIVRGGSADCGLVAA